MSLPAQTPPVAYLLMTASLLYWQVNTPNDAAILQQDLHDLEQWAEKWLMKF